MLIILSSIIVPGFWTLLVLMLLFSWMSLVDLVRAEFLRARNLDFVRAARALGAGNPGIMRRHMLPNAMVSTLTFMPFILNGSITALTSLDFLGFGLPPGSPSLGRAALQGKNNLQAPWLGITGFVVLGADAVAAGLRRRGGARRLRPAQDVPAEARHGAARGRDLSVDFRRRRAPGRGRARRLLRRSTAARPWRMVGESGSGKSVTALSILQLLPYPAASHPDRQHPPRRPGAGRPPTTALLRTVRGDRVGMIFQEPMTSLNPLHTVERQVGEVLIVHRGLGRAGRARPRRWSCCAWSASRCRDAARRLPAPALRRPAPAGDDRHGAGERARPADRRRADHRARRHHPGADPAAAEGAAGAGSAWRCC